MSMPFYVAPEQVMKDRADYARKGIARGRSLVALECEAGVLIVADNASRTLSKISEIYDRIAFAAVGKYNEFQLLKVAGVRHAVIHHHQHVQVAVVTGLPAHVRPKQVNPLRLGCLDETLDDGVHFFQGFQNRGALDK